jgi:hypothetical protein
MRKSEWDELTMERKAEVRALKVLKHMQAADMEKFAAAAMDPNTPEEESQAYERLYVAAYRVVITIDSWIRTGGPHL